MQDGAFNKKSSGAVNGELWQHKMQGCVSRVTALALPDGLAWPCLLHKNVVNNLIPLSEPWRRAPLSWSTDDFLGFTCLDKEEKRVERRLFHRAKEWLARSTGSKGSLGRLDCLEPVLLLFQCAASLVWGDGPLAVGSPGSCLCPVAHRWSWVAQMLLFWHPK